MSKTYPYSQIKDLIAGSQKILVAIPRNPSFDQVAAALSLYLSLEKLGKEPFVVSPDKMIVSFSHLVGLDKIKESISGNDLVITVERPLEDIERVFTTNEQKGKLKVIIRTKQGKEPLEKESLSFSQQGVSPDLIFTIGSHRLEGLGKIFQEKKEIFSQKPVVNIDDHAENTSFGQINLLDEGASCLCEIVTFLLQGLSLPINQDIASNLLLGLRKTTENFQNKVSADTFEAASFALRAQEKSLPSREGLGEGTKEDSDKPPEEWLEPKIYKGSTLP